MIFRRETSKIRVVKKVGDAKNIQKERNREFGSSSEFWPLFLHAHKVEA
jgi:hypothetical protein